MQVTHTAASTSLFAPPRRSRRQSVALVGGVLATLTSFGVTLAYMTVLSSYVQNDYFWTNFNAAAQTYMSDVYNAQLWKTSDDLTALGLFSPDVAIAKDYAVPHTAIAIHASRNRRFAAEELSDVAFAVASLRAQTIRKSSRSLTCHCWLDFDQRWQVAFTVKRQERCLARYADNAAAYLEAMLRNTDWPKWYVMWGSGFDVAYGTALQEAEGGTAWLERTKAALSSTSVAAEVQLWTRHNVTRYTVAWHNHQEIGFDNSVTIRNVFESFSLPLQHVISQRGFWTSALASQGVWNGYYYAIDYNASLVRSASNSFVLLPEAKSPEMWTGGYPDTVWSVLLHNVVGAIGSLDLLYVPPPRSLLQLSDLVHKALVQDIQLHHHLKAPPSTTAFDMVPPKWRGYSYAGGNPLCYTGKLRSYVQQSIGFDDACASPYAQMTVDASFVNIVMAQWLVLQFHGDIDAKAICALTGSATTAACEDRLLAAKQFIVDWQVASSFDVAATTTLAPIALQETTRLRVELMQYASHNGTSLILHQTLLDKDDPSWSFFGWLHLLDWVQGAREVVAVDGDESTVVLMSKQYDPQAFVVDPLATPNRFAFALWLLAWYVNVVMFVVAAIALVSTILGQSALSLRNLVSANRVAGIVWIGRPLLMLRGLTAIVLLSTAKIELVTTNGYTSFAVEPRKVWETLVVSGESLWLTYAISDVLSLFTAKHTRNCGMLSGGVAWAAAVVLDLASPVVATATAGRQCVSTNMEIQLSCVSGEVEIGSFHRFALLGIVHLVAIGVAWCVSAVVDAKASNSKVPVIIPAVAAAHFERHEAAGLYFDVSSSIFSGILPFRTTKHSGVFSVLLWVDLPTFERTELAVFRTPTLRLCPQMSAGSGVGPVNQLLVTRRREFLNRHQRVRAFVGLVFLAVSAASSASFFFVTESKISNNFLWEGFNSTGMQAFLIDWYNVEGMFRRRDTVLNASSVHLQAWYNGTATTVSTSQYSSNNAHFHDVTVLAVIAGLQTTSPCDLPWVATQYCWVDFGRRWDVANSAQRQRRCDQHMRSNGAVYIEALLRNTDMVKFSVCWGDAIEAGLFRHLRQSSQGQQWMHDIYAAPLPPPDELVLWASHNLTSFTMQWQNYKSIGLVETLLVQSALGLSSPLTMKASNGSYRFELETSRKMYWGWGGDLTAVAQNATRSGGSLIRSAATFVFQNTSIEAVLGKVNIAPNPLDAGLALVRSALGPFGSTDMFHVACPQSLLNLARQFIDADLAAMLDRVDAQRPVPTFSDVMFPTPTAWQRYSLARGGNLLCPVNSGSLPMSSGMFTLLTMYMPCGTYIWEMFSTARKGLTFAALAWGAASKCASTGPCAPIQDVCSKTTAASAACVDNYMAVVEWTKQFVTSATRADFLAAARPVQQELIALRVEVLQYAQRTASSPLELLRAALLDPADPHFDLVAWQVMFEWAMGHREVVSFVGDAGAINVLSAYSIYMSTQPNPLEIPTTGSFYCIMCLQYTTAVIFAVTLITIVFTIASRGYIEGLNMIEVNRVAGIVWVGRPLLTLRSLAAISLLATSSVQLTSSGTLTSVASNTNHGWVATLLSGSETCWLVIVITDVGMAITKDYTNKYSLYTNVVATALATLLSVVSPVRPNFVLNRTCSTPQVNFQVECVAGVVQIGSVPRVVQLVVLTSVVVVLCYLWERWRHPLFKLPQHDTSLLLPAGALYLYHKGPWIYKGTLYLDKASAFMCGLIAVSYERQMFVLDIKTWRVHVIDIDEGVYPQHMSMGSRQELSMASAVPLID